MRFAGGVREPHWLIARTAITGRLFRSLTARCGRLARKGPADTWMIAIEKISDEALN